MVGINAHHTKVTRSRWWSCVMATVLKVTRWHFHFRKIGCASKSMMPLLLPSASMTDTLCCKGFDNKTLSYFWSGTCTSKLNECHCYGGLDRFHLIFLPSSPPPQQQAPPLRGNTAHLNNPHHLPDMVVAARASIQVTGFRMITPDEIDGSDDSFCEKHDPPLEHACTIIITFYSWQSAYVSWYSSPLPPLSFWIRAFFHRPWISALSKKAREKGGHFENVVGCAWPPPFFHLSVTHMMYTHRHGYISFLERE